MFRSSLCFSSRSKKQDLRPGYWLTEPFSSETAERDLRKLDRTKDLNALYQVSVFRTDRKNKMAALVSDWLRHFRLLLWKRWTEFNESWQKSRSQRLLPSLCFSGRPKKNNIYNLASDWLRHFRLLLLNCSMEFNEIWQEEWFQHRQPSLRADRKTTWPPYSLIGWNIFLNSPLKPLNKI